MEDYKLLPYGILNYVQIRRDNRYWVDKSMYPDIRHSYIIELKYLPMTATEAEAERQWKVAESQIRGYSEGPVVHRMTQGTTLHLVIAQLKGYDLLKLAQVDEFLAKPIR
ncbi:MAG: PD-(D/E)XK nuclease domain-containing protein [bacterium]|nr:PD-(D/E)XK nuclease domain-containing protein [bacterium]